LARKTRITTSSSRSLDESLEPSVAGKLSKLGIGAPMSSTALYSPATRAPETKIAAIKTTITAICHCRASIFFLL
jgi:hypothetical protein